MKPSDAHRTAVDRATMRKTLAKEWIELHRPDVMKVIDEEVAKVYPYKYRRLGPVSLPKSLEKLK